MDPLPQEWRLLLQEGKLIIKNTSVFSLAEWLERWPCNSKVPGSSPALTASWICSR